MALSDNGTDMIMPVGPMNGNGMFGGMGEGGFFWYFILFFFFMMFGWGGYGYGGGSQPVANDVQRGFDQQAIMSGFADNAAALNGLAMNMQNCCCENRAATADLKYTIATEACADRTAVNNALMQLENSISGKVQIVLDKLCQQELDALKAKNAELQTQINISALRESQALQTSAVLADNAAQTATLKQALNPTPIPAYVVGNPNGCNCGQNFGCGC